MCKIPKCSWNCAISQQHIVKNWFKIFSKGSLKTFADKSMSYWWVKIVNWKKRKPEMKTTAHLLMIRVLFHFCVSLQTDEKALKITKPSTMYLAIWYSSKPQTESRNWSDRTITLNEPKNQKQPCFRLRKAPE